MQLEACISLNQCIVHFTLTLSCHIVVFQSFPLNKGLISGLLIFLVYVFDSESHHQNQAILSLTGQFMIFIRARQQRDDRK